MRIGPYELESEIGRGGMAVVFRARDPRGSQVAIKLLARKDAGPLRRFEREVRLQSALGEAAGFLPVLDSGVHEGSPFLVLPLVEGGTLRDRLARGPLVPGEVRSLGSRLARALGAAHARGIVHRDVKPENVLFTARGEPLVADLGLAKHFDDSAPGASRSASISGTGRFLGTVHYMAPEQLADAKTAGPPADVFALGAVLYECLSGTCPFPGDTVLEIVERIEKGSFVPIARLRPDAPRDLARVIDRALARDPARRFLDGAAFARALGGPRLASRRPRIAAALALLVATGSFAALRARHAGEASRGTSSSTDAGELVRRSLTLVAARDERARAAAAAAVAASPGSAPAHAALALALRAEGRHAEADEEAGKATDLDARCALGWAARSWASDTADRIALAERALALDRDLAWAWLARASAKPLEAPGPVIEDATRAIELDPRLAEAWTLRAAARFEQKDDEGASADVARALELSTRIPAAYQIRAALRDVGHDFRGAVDDVTRELQLEPSAASFAARAGYEEDGGEYEAAVEDASRALALDEQVAVAWAFRAHAREELHDLDRALSDATRAIELLPLAANHIMRARIREARGERREMRADYERFLALAPTDPAGADVRQWLAENPPGSDPPDDPRTAAEIDAALEEPMRRNDLTLALRLAARLIALGPAVARSWETRAEVRERAGDLAGAEADATQAIDLAPGWRFPWLERARLRSARGDLAGALADDERAVTLSPGNGDDWAELAALRGKANDMEGALAAAARAIACVPPSPVAWYSLGLLLDQAGNVTGARAAFDRVLCLAPSGFVGVRARSWLESHPR